jgi:hypothetical protein
MSEPLKLVSVMSYARVDRACDGCGQARLIYSADIHPERVIRDRCKDCLLKIAEDGAKTLHIKTTWPKLREVWAKDRRIQPTKLQREQMAAGRAKRAVGGVSSQENGVSTAKASRGAG